MFSICLHYKLTPVIHILEQPTASFLKLFWDISMSIPFYYSDVHTIMMPVIHKQWNTIIYLTSHTRFWISLSVFHFKSCNKETKTKLFLSYLSLCVFHSGRDAHTTTTPVIQQYKPTTHLVSLKLIPVCLWLPQGSLSAVPFVTKKSDEHVGICSTVLLITSVDVNCVFFGFNRQRI